jgi:hypothetical protein
MYGQAMPTLTGASEDWVAAYESRFVGNAVPYAR